MSLPDKTAKDLPSTAEMRCHTAAFRFWSRMFYQDDEGCFARDAEVGNVNRPGQSTGEAYWLTSLAFILTVGASFGWLWSSFSGGVIGAVAAAPLSVLLAFVGLHALVFSLGGLGCLLRAWHIRDANASDRPPVFVFLLALSLFAVWLLSLETWIFSLAALPWLLWMGINVLFWVLLRLDDLRLSLGRLS